MDHSEAVLQMATERYLLNDLTPELRDAFEEHFFDCPECALDLRATAAFVDVAKTYLPELTADALPAPALSQPKQLPAKPRAESTKRNWSSWWQPLFNPMLAGPVFAGLLLIVGYQNLLLYPALRSQATEPRFMQQVALRDTMRDATRSGSKKTAEVSHKVDLEVELSLPQNDSYQSFAFELYDAQGKAVWNKAISEPAASLPTDGSLSLAVPTTGLQSGAYSLAVSGVSANGTRAVVGSYDIELHFTD